MTPTIHATLPVGATFTIGWEDDGATSEAADSVVCRARVLLPGQSVLDPDAEEIDFTVSYRAATDTVRKGYDATLDEDANTLLPNRIYQADYRDGGVVSPPFYFETWEPVS